MITTWKSRNHRKWCRLRPYPSAISRKPEEADLEVKQKEKNPSSSQSLPIIEETSVSVQQPTITWMQSPFAFITTQ
ncbi:hypothetical protein KIN20_009547 [Parelaphostrongylus tenuis]|uniref:Uncharacterized protein n=1 Tax=Parelaphostrongylus tenuis TaxID=148309 RepID=A0AAD5QJP5_PARTN|nr:hypothetical protein KIN20_006708 [Parelaphostrongylus tenuis]KAJ1352000.1 hypothetical protein KIN20_008186 [Parelaphostrongylus tenuis]KAJ1353007.1 hypothetical protein KIN20_009547 [Parelaphostrongylus tenuis]